VRKVETKPVNGGWQNRGGGVDQTTAATETETGRRFGDRRTAADGFTQFHCPSAAVPFYTIESAGQPTPVAAAAVLDWVKSGRTTPIGRWEMGKGWTCGTDLEELFVEPRHYLSIFYEWEDKDGIKW